jgi:iron(III) transport system permease protein
VYAPAEAAVLASPVVALAILIVATERMLARRHGEALSSRGGTHDTVALGRTTWFAAALAVAGAAFSWLPLVGLLVRALRGHGFVDAWLRLGNTVENSLLVAGLAAGIGTALAVVIGHGLARGSKVARGLDLLGLAAFLTPAAVGGVGVITAWNRPATAWVYGTMAALVLCLVGRYSVVAIRVFGAGVSQRPESHEAAAATCGAGYLRRLFGIVVPESRRALAGAWLLGAVFCLRDVETAILVYPPGGETLPVRIFTLEANGPESSVAALALFHVALTTVVLATMAALLTRRGART